MDIKEEIKRISDLKEESEKKTVEYRSGLDELQKRLVDGESSGDNMQDYVVAHYGISPELKDYFSGFKKTLDEQVGKEIMFVTEQDREEDLVKYAIEGDENTHHNLMPPPRHISSEIDLQLGILSGPVEFDVKSSDLYLPAEYHVLGRARGVKWDDRILESLNLELKEGKITVPGYLIPLPEELRQLPYILRLSARIPKEILLGENIGKYFERTFRAEDYTNAKKMLEEKLPWNG